jgi:hypothetical protein
MFFFKIDLATKVGIHGFLQKGFDSAGLNP